MRLLSGHEQQSGDVKQVSLPWLFPCASTLSMGGFCLYPGDAGGGGLQAGTHSNAEQLW